MQGKESYCAAAQHYGQQILVSRHAMDYFSFPAAHACRAIMIKNIVRLFDTAASSWLILVGFQHDSFELTPFRLCASYCTILLVPSTYIDSKLFSRGRAA